jgi:hypothetical protein
VDDDEAVLDKRTVLSEALAVLDAFAECRAEQVEQSAHLDLARAVAGVARRGAAVKFDGSDGLTRKIYNDLRCFEFL